MSSTEHGFEPKWTPGTIAYVDALCRTHHSPTYTELAAAVLAYSDNPSIADHRTVKEHDALLSIAERLRMIGADE